MDAPRRKLKEGPLNALGDGAHISKAEAGYPRALAAILGDAAPERLAYRGELSILRRRKLALFCSIRCPGSIILESYDVARQLRTAGLALIGGFHTPMEKECLDFLMRGNEPVIVCPARGIELMRVPPQWRRAISAHRMLLLSPFRATQRRATQATADARNRLVAALADQLLIIHAAPGGKTEQLCRDMIARGKTIAVLDRDANRHLIEAGATPIAGISALGKRQSPQI